MDNHQAQLAEQMEKQKYLMVSTPEWVVSFLLPVRFQRRSRDQTLAVAEHNHPSALDR